ncbi:MAG TPA: SIS domain-containing protein [Terriglobales bacterium]|nr:SIS domain-containing protein [Terriglobales bacterium]
MTFQSGCRPYFEHLSRTIEALPFERVDAVADVLVEAYEKGKTIFTFGNGGSAALASHFACDLGKGTVNGSGKRFRVMALTDNVPLMTAWANDSNYENIFSEQLANFAAQDDVAFAISGSGNSPNVLKALKLAKKAGLTTTGMAGFAGGAMRALCDTCIIVPCENMQIIEDLHLCIAHSLFSCVRARIASESAARPVLRPHLVNRSVAR